MTRDLNSQAWGHRRPILSRYAVFPFQAMVVALLISGPVLAADAPSAAAAPPASEVQATPDEQQIKELLNAYKIAIEKLDPSGTESLFSSDAQIFESGGVEGTYAQYLAGHLTPELAEFKSFTFSDYTVQVRIDGAFAFATESYGYRIELKAGGDPVERLGVTTSVLKKTDGAWRIIQLHSSSRRPKAVEPPPVKP